MRAISTAAESRYFAVREARRRNECSVGIAGLLSSFARKAPSCLTRLCGPSLEVTERSQALSGVARLTVEPRQILHQLDVLFTGREHHWVDLLSQPEGWMRQPNLLVGIRDSQQQVVVVDRTPHDGVPRALMECSNIEPLLGPNQSRLSLLVDVPHPLRSIRSLSDSAVVSNQF